MPRLKLSCLSPFAVGPLVTTSGQVISGAGSPGQQVWIGSRPRSMSAPVSTISWHGALPTVRGFIAITVRSKRQHVERLAPAAGRLGLAQEGQGLADLAQLMRFAVHAPGDALDRAEQVDQHGMSERAAVGADDVLEQHRRAPLGQEPGLDLGHLEHRERRVRSRAPAGRFVPAGP